MIILTLRTDKPLSEVGLFDDAKKLAYEKWEAHRQLAETIHLKIEKVLKSQNLDWNDIEGIVIFSGPGSYTGLRIGVSVANALAANLPAKLIGTNEKDWLEKGLKRLINGENDQQVFPDYGAPAFTTAPKK